jgi:hypothetical protein
MRTTAGRHKQQTPLRLCVPSMSYVLVVMLVLSPFLIMAGGYLGLWLATHGGEL